MISSYLSTSGRVHHDPVNTDSKGRSENSDFSTGNTANGSGNCWVSVSAAHYFKRPFFIGTNITPVVGGGGVRQHTFEKSLRRISQEWWPDRLSSDSLEYFYRENITKQNDYKTGITVNISTGAGHIDDVTFAVVAMNMLDRIAANETTYTGCSAGAVQKLAALIEKRRKRRTLDARIAFIDNIDTLSTLIRECGIAEVLSPRTVLELADQWNYAFDQTRRKGRSVRLYPEFSYTRDYMRNVSESNRYELGMTGTYDIKENEHRDFDDFDTSYTISRNDTKESYDMSFSLNLMARYERPLSRNLQLSVNAHGYAQVNRTWNDYCRTGSGDSIACLADVPTGGLNESVEFSYYPNTRTTVAITQNISYLRGFDFYNISLQRKTGGNPVPPAPDHDYRNLTIGLSGSAQYYFSPQLLGVFSIGMNWSDMYNASYYNFWDTSGFETTRRTQFNYFARANVNWKLF